MDDTRPHISWHLAETEVGKRKTKAALVMDKKREKELLQYRITKWVNGHKNVYKEII